MPDADPDAQEAAGTVITCHAFRSTLTVRSKRGRGGTHRQPAGVPAPVTPEPEPTSAPLPDGSSVAEVPPRRGMRAGPLALIVAAGAALIGLGILLVVLIVQRGKELDTPVAKKGADPAAKAKTVVKGKGEPKGKAAPREELPPVIRAENDPPREWRPDAEAEARDLVYNVAILVTLLIAVPIYFLPTIIAAMRKHTNLLALFMLNLLLGVVFLGWAIAMVWACWTTAPQVHKHIHYHND